MSTLNPKQAAVKLIKMADEAVRTSQAQMRSSAILNLEDARELLYKAQETDDRQDYLYSARKSVRAIGYAGSTFSGPYTSAKVIFEATFGHYR